MSDLFKLDLRDVSKGLVVAVFTGIITWLASLVSVPGFDLSTLDWKKLLTVAVIAGVSYLAKNFLTTDNGKVAGFIG